MDKTDEIVLFLAVDNFLLVFNRKIIFMANYSNYMVTINVGVFQCLKSGDLHNDLYNIDILLTYCLAYSPNILHLVEHLETRYLYETNFPLTSPKCSLVQIEMFNIFDERSNGTCRVFFCMTFMFLP